MFVQIPARITPHGLSFTISQSTNQPINQPSLSCFLLPLPLGLRSKPAFIGSPACVPLHLFEPCVPAWRSDFLWPLTHLDAGSSLSHAVVVNGFLGPSHWHVLTSFLGDLASMPLPLVNVPDHPGQKPLSPPCSPRAWNSLPPSLPCILVVSTRASPITQ